jgi:hypothetical protein
VHAVGLGREQALPMRASAPRPACAGRCAREDVIAKADRTRGELPKKEHNEKSTLLRGVSMSEREVQGRRETGRTYASSATPRRASIRRSCATSAPFSCRNMPFLE